MCSSFAYFAAYKISEIIPKSAVWLTNFWLRLIENFATICQKQTHYTKISGEHSELKKLKKSRAPTFRFLRHKSIQQLVKKKFSYIRKSATPQCFTIYINFLE